MSYFMDPGEMNREIKLQKKATTTNDYNEEVDTWPTEATVFARRRDMSGKEGMEGGQIVTSSQVEWTIYFYEGLNPGDYRIEDEYGNIFDITARPREKGFRQYMEVDTKIRDNQ